MFVMSHNSAIRRVQHNLVIHTQRYIQDVLNKSEFLKVADMQKHFRYQAAALATCVLNPGRNKQYLCADVWRLYICFYVKVYFVITKWVWVNFLKFFTLWCNLQMFLDTMEPITENKHSSLEKNCFDNVGSDMWNNCQNCP